MSEIAISVESLGKSYLVGHNARAENYTALRDVLARGARDLARKTHDMFTGRAIVQGDEIEEFWALRDVSFELKKGERLGIIGRNGAGKSTLLKLLSRITEPSEGRIRINGRVASLLEVGTGFHPELTGRENIFLNGAILGMSRKEIRRKFDEIVAFAEVEKFLDTPVKRYSSGMYVRLAFAVAAHLEPEILIVDEVLAVGDAQFQKKCLGKMEEVGREGRTVLFVSHNMGAIKNLCTEIVYLEKGRVARIGAPNDVISEYINSGSRAHGLVKNVIADESKKITLIELDIRSADGNKVDSVISGEAIHFFMKIRSKRASMVKFYISIEDANSSRLALLSNALTGEISNLNEGEFDVECVIDRLPLVAGQYNISLKITDGMESQIWLASCAKLSVENGDYYNNGIFMSPDLMGSVLIDQKWLCSSR